MLTLKSKLETNTCLGDDRPSLAVSAVSPERPDLEARYSMATGYVDDPKAKKLAERLSKAINAGKAFTTPRVMTDTAGKDYLGFDVEVSGRHLNADLKRLGF
jgi:hypothetical protein